jgi:hypothetical protein
MAKLIEANGAEHDVSPANGRFTREEIGGLLHTREEIERVPAPPGHYMFVAGGGKCKPHKPNETATRMFHNAGGRANDYIAGAALICLVGEYETT